MPPKPGGIDKADIDPIDQDATTLRHVEALHQLGQRRLARARRADDADDLARQDVDADIQQHRRSVEADLAEAPRGEAGETVLVVEDEPTVRMLVADILEDLGCTAIEAGNSAAGLKVLQSDVRIDLLVTDVGLPGGMNGRQMADAARVARPDLKVLFITGYAENAILGNGHLAPGMAVLTKPFPVETMAACIRSMLTA